MGEVVFGRGMRCEFEGDEEAKSLVFISFRLLLENIHFSFFLIRSILTFNFLFLSTLNLLFRTLNARTSIALLHLLLTLELHQLFIYILNIYFQLLLVTLPALQINLFFLVPLVLPFKRHDFSDLLQLFVLVFIIWLHIPLLLFTLNHFGIFCQVAVCFGVVVGCIVLVLITLIGVLLQYHSLGLLDFYLFVFTFGQIEFDWIIAVCEAIFFVAALLLLPVGRYVQHHLGVGYLLIVMLQVLAVGINISSAAVSIIIALLGVYHPELHSQCIVSGPNINA